MIYKILTMGGEKITIESEDALRAFLDEANSGKKLVVTKYGIVNVSSIDSIVRHKEKMEEIADCMRYGKSKQDAEKEVLGSSIFAKLLSSESKMLS